MMAADESLPEGDGHGDFANRQAVPFLLRRLPAVGVALATLVTGVAQLVISASINHHHPWAADLLINTGATTVLFAPLLVLTSVFGRKFAHSQHTRDEEMARMSSDVSDLHQQIESALAQIHETTMRRIDQDREEDLKAILAVAVAPESSLVARSLRLGRRLGFTSVTGPRVRIRDSDAFARWELSDSVQDSVLVTVETFEGASLGTHAWLPNESADDLTYAIARVLQGARRYPGDAAYHSAGIFAELGHLLELGYRADTGAGGLVDPIGPILQLTGKDWVLTDFCITTRSWPQYQVTLDRLDELDWDAHLRGRQGIDIVGFREAFDLAKILIANGRLIPPKPESRIPEVSNGAGEQQIGGSSR